MIDLPQIYTIPLAILALLIAIIGHEIMHGLVALKYGDSTAKDAGRLSINPLIHLDLVGSILLPALLLILQAPFLFGWAKPVPIRMDRVINRGGYFGAFSVSLAGIFYNLCLALFASFLLFLIDSSILDNTQLGNMASIILFLGIYFLMQIISYNVILAIFNLFPIPPLDGSNALAYLGLMFKSSFFANLFNKIPPIAGMIFLMVILSTPLSQIIFIPAQFMINLFL